MSRSLNISCRQLGHLLLKLFDLRLKFKKTTNSCKRQPFGGQADHPFHQVDLVHAVAPLPAFGSCRLYDCFAIQTPKKCVLHVEHFGNLTD